MMQKQLVMLVIAVLFIVGCIQNQVKITNSQTSPTYSNGIANLPSASPINTSSISINSYQTREDHAERVTNPVGSASDQNPAFLDDHTLVFTRFLEGYNTGPAALMGLYLFNGTEFVIWQDESQNVNVNGNPFTPDKKQICYASDVEQSDEIWCLDLASKNRTRITHHIEDTHFIEPTVSRDGKTIYFEVHANGANTPGKIWVSDFNGNTAALVDDTADNRLPMVASHDNRILFQRNQGNDFRLFVRETNGELKELNITTEIGTDASWASQNSIVYSADGKDLQDGVQSTHPKIYEFNLKTQEGQKLTSAGFEDGAPAVSPDGKTLAFESHLNENEQSPSRIWVKTSGKSMDP